jgi:hypothetical protein
MTFRNNPSAGSGPGTPASDRRHPCPGPGCATRIDRHRLMCLRHWRMVPRPLQAAIWRAWNGGRGAGSPEHAEAILAAIDAVERRAAQS